MNSFVSSPAPAATPSGTVIACGPFWPDIDVNHFRNAMRIGGTAIPDARLADVLMNAVVTVLHDLSTWQAAQELAGFATLVTVPQVQIGTVKRLELLWRRAVYGFATADLAETHRDMTATATGQARAPELDMRADDHRRNAIHAIREILGKDRTTVELI
jgi:hypothetical protein